MGVSPIVVLVVSFLWVGDVGALAHGPGESVVAAERGDSDMILAGCGIVVMAFEVFFHNRVEVETGTCSIVEQRRWRTKRVSWDGSFPGSSRKRARE